MGRIRTIKPEFPQSQSIGKLSREARLLFIQIWTIVDDAGRARAASRMLASLLYPFDDDAKDLVDGWLCELCNSGLIRQYQIDGTDYLDVVKWLEHQKIDHPSKSRLPEFREDLARVRDTLAPDLGPRTLDLGKKDIRSIAKAMRPPRCPNPDFEAFKKAYPKRSVSNPWKPAFLLFEKAVKAGTSAAVITKAAEAYHVECDRNNITDTDKVAQAQTWLRQERYSDYIEPDGSSPKPTFDIRKHLV